ncbi:hypothetical protein [Novosphingobium sp. EMRT-2]|uniref:hypothetical protein n=1 Tax=Novosphingobium sp. EMRT-2 TaxID=2571749 RepID=UPI0010BDF343|nr:hypothetical protein [Novosphingobium sp. EMRT-2]QCI92318.1 hypothetical protein FA702_01200 [Novosphingobium sp. EMRT-2]
MALPDALAGAQLAGGYFDVAWLAWLDFDGDPVRVTTAGRTLILAGTGDAELDGTFDAVDPSLVGVTEVHNKEGGAETLSFTLSGIVGPDTDLLNVLGNAALWRGRTARLWAAVYDAAGVQQGAIWPFYTGRMSALQIVGEPSGQTVKLDVETYLASLTKASGRTYLDQAQFDNDDNTAALTIGIANGSTKGVAGASSVRGAGVSERASTLRELYL